MPSLLHSAASPAPRTPTHYAMSALSAAKEHERCIDPGRRIFAASRTAAFRIAR